MPHTNSQPESYLPVARSSVSDPRSGLRRGFTIADGQGGVLSLDLASPHLGAFAEACRLLSKGPLRSGATVLIVRLETAVYVLSYCAGPRGTTEIQIASLHDPLSRIRLSPELAEIVAALVDEGAQRDSAPPNARYPSGA